MPWYNALDREVGVLVGLFLLSTNQIIWKAVFSSDEVFLTITDADIPSLCLLGFSLNVLYRPIQPKVLTHVHPETADTKNCPYSPEDLCLLAGEREHRRVNISRSFVISQAQTDELHQTTCTK